MATVYRAVDLRHDRVVAIKVMNPDFAETVGRDRFLREIRVTAGLSHPHILALSGSGDVGVQPTLLLLKRRLAERPASGCARGDLRVPSTSRRPGVRRSAADLPALGRRKRLRPL